MEPNGVVVVDCFLKGQFSNYEREQRLRAPQHPLHACPGRNVQGTVTRLEDAQTYSSLRQSGTRSIIVSTPGGGLSPELCAAPVRDNCEEHDFSGVQRCGTRSDKGHMRRRLRTGRGIAAAVLTVLVVIVGTASSHDPGGSLLGLVILSPIGWWFWWVVLGMLSGDLVRGSPPAVRVGRQWQSNGSTRQQLREDGNARVFADRGGILLRRRHWFVGSGTPPFEIPEGRWNQVAVAQFKAPQHLVTWRDRDFWWYDDAFYWSTAGAYASADVKAVLFTRQRQNERELEHAHAVLAASTSPATRKREPIPKDVRLAVWQRDEGKCVECGSDFDIQYDHIIPFSMGGASTVENLQLSCARCNQVKGGRL